MDEDLAILEPDCCYPLVNFLREEAERLIKDGTRVHIDPPVDRDMASRHRLQCHG